MSHSPLLGLVALGPVDPKILRRLRTAIAKILPLSVQLLRPRPLPPHLYHVTRGQYHSNQLLEYLLAENNPKIFRILGITAVDLYIPILTFVFGEAQLEGKAAIISIFRPRGDAGGAIPPQDVLLKRLIKLSLHELGHTFGLGHCRQEACLMGFSSNLEKLDQNHLAFCKYCQVLLTDFFRGLGLEPRLKRDGETPGPGAPIPTADRRRRHRL
jgi:archaemetzincin